MTKGVKIKFHHPGNLIVESIPIFSGRKKYPQSINTKTCKSLIFENDEWVFPTSGVVFVY